MKKSFKVSKNKENYKDVVWCWTSPPNNLPLFTNDFFDKNFVKNTKIDIEQCECCRQQILAVRAGLVN